MTTLLYEETEPMYANRIRQYPLMARRPAKASPTAVASIPPGFAVCPPSLLTPNAWQQQIYRLAYEKARATVEVPRHYRRMFSVWN
jgi:hypothetical protein